MTFNMRISTYMKFFFFLWIFLTEAQPLFASTSKSSAQEDLSSRNYQLKVLFKLSGIESTISWIKTRHLVVSRMFPINSNDEVGHPH